MPNRHQNTGDYRYGFQGQEMDDEIKGEGNSLNYTFRMHDPRVGRFFAVDPLTKKYPHYSPYSFSGNKVIAYKELEGLEETMATRMQYYDQKEYLKGNISAEELIERDKARAYGTIIGLGVQADILLTKGQVSKYLLRQLGAQLTVNAFVEGTYWAISGGDDKFDAHTVLEETFTGFDLADAGIDKGVELLLDKYKIGKIKTAITAVAPSLFDITIEDGVQIVGWNKEGSKIITDIVGNILTGGLETTLKDTGLEMPTIKLSAAKEADAIGSFIMDGIDAIMTAKENDGKNKINIDIDKIKKRISQKEKEMRETKKDVIPNN